MELQHKIKFVFKYVKILRSGICCFPKPWRWAPDSWVICGDMDTAGDDAGCTFLLPIYSVIQKYRLNFVSLISFLHQKIATRYATTVLPHFSIHLSKTRQHSTHSTSYCVH